MFASAIGLIVSACCWGFLELVHLIEVGVYQHLPHHFGYSVAPLWWPLPWLALAGLLTAFAVVRLPGDGGHVPAEGLKVGGAPTQPIELPGVLLATLATLGLGLVLGPEAPLIAIGMGRHDRSQWPVLVDVWRAVRPSVSSSLRERAAISGGCAALRSGCGVDECADELDGVGSGDAVAGGE